MARRSRAHHDHGMTDRHDQNILISLSPSEQKLVLETVEVYPGLPIAQAPEMLPVI